MLLRTKKKTGTWNFYVRCSSNSCIKMIASKRLQQARNHLLKVIFFFFFISTIFSYTLHCNFLPRNVCITQPHSKLTPFNCHFCFSCFLFHFICVFFFCHFRIPFVYYDPLPVTLSYCCVLINTLFCFPLKTYLQFFCFFSATLVTKWHLWYNEMK